MMRTISATEANQTFSRLLRNLERDCEGYLILRRGRPVARLIPESGDRLTDPAWKNDYARMMDRLNKGVNLGGLRIDRDELYER